MKDNCDARLFGFKKVQAFLPQRPLAFVLSVFFLEFSNIRSLFDMFLTLKKVPQAKWRHLIVLSIFHMSMVIFPDISHNFHMSGFKKTIKNKKKKLRLVSCLLPI